MRIEELKDQCTGCGACMSECPKQCITMPVDEEGFYFPHIDKSRCISCGKCERVCHCINRGVVDELHSSYYGFSKNAEIRKSSTSGGVFATLANQVIEEGGKVYGAAFDFSDLRLKHCSTDEVTLAALQKSKYVESYMGDTIAKIQRDLKNGYNVMFCGTPCQAAGVRKVLGNAENLLICDFICHGVPSAEIFRDYIFSLLHKNEQVVELEFRPKKNGWSSKNIKIVKNTKTTTIPYYLDFFYKGFMDDSAFLRKCCYNCQYRITHLSDITIADFWGYCAINPALNDEKGLSLIVANSTKGKKAVEGLSNFELHAMDNRFSDYAFAAKDYSRYSKNRELFYAEYRGNSLKRAALKTYMKDYYIQMAKYKVKKILHRV